MVGKEPETGRTGKTVAENIKRLRGDMSYTQLSRRLQERADWFINPVGIRRIEAGERRVGPDDLMALAVALGVSPVTLLIPDSPDRKLNVEVTGLSQLHDVDYVWDWLRAEKALPGMSDVEFISRAWPSWLQHRERILVDKLIEREAEKASDGDD
jgi:transcriptional regulator with XRE-family HTH domain